MEQTFDEYYRTVKQAVIQKIPLKYVNKTLEQTFKSKKYIIESWYIHKTYNIEDAAMEFIRRFVA